MNRQSSTDFDVITGPSTASACPVVESVPAALATPPVTETPAEAAPGQAAEAAAA